MQRRVPQVPEIDMTAMMGLSAILIVLLLTASAPPYAAIETKLPGVVEDPEPDPTVVPTIGLTRTGAWLQVGDSERVVFTNIDDLADALIDARSLHELDGRFEILPGEDVPYDDVIRAIDVARIADFDSVSFAGGLMPTPSSR